MAKAPPRQRSAAPLSRPKDQGDNGPEGIVAQVAREVGFEICGVVCGVDGWGVCRKPIGHSESTHLPHRPGRSIPTGYEGNERGWDDDPRHEQEQIHRAVSS
jgi:hypothetical protein